MSSEEWTTIEHVSRYLERADEFPHHLEGEHVLLEYVPRDARRVLDIGTGDGRLLALLQANHPEIAGVGIDFSDVMLAQASKRFEGNRRVGLVEHDLTEPLPALGRFDAVVSSFVIHHLEHERKRSLYAEVLDLLEPGGVFANFEHVASPTRRLHLAFFEAIGEPIEHEAHPTVCSMYTPSCSGCGRSGSMMSTATGSGSIWRCSSASSRDGHERNDQTPREDPVARRQG